MASASSRRPGHITSTACEQCRSKKAKVCGLARSKRIGRQLIWIQCDGARPACSKCAAKGFDCTYATAEGQTRVQALRDDNASLRGRLDMMVRILQGVGTSCYEGLLPCGTIIASLRQHLSSLT